MAATFFAAFAALFSTAASFLTLVTSTLFTFLAAAFTVCAAFAALFSTAAAFIAVVFFVMRAVFVHSVVMMVFVFRLFRFRSIKSRKSARIFAAFLFFKFFAVFASALFAFLASAFAVGACFGTTFVAVMMRMEMSFHFAEVYSFHHVGETDIFVVFSQAFKKETFEGKSAFEINSRIFEVCHFLRTRLVSFGGR